MSNYEIWTIEMLGARIVEWRERLRNARDREQLLSIWGEIEKMEAAFSQAVFENRTEQSRSNA